MSAWRYPCSVLRVIDGDTIVVSVFDPLLGLCLSPLHCRLAGINAPELHAEGGPRSREMLAGVLAPGTEIVIGSRRDKYQRALVEVFQPGLAGSVNDWLVQQGLAVACLTAEE